MANYYIEKFLDSVKDCVGSRKLKFNPEKSFIDLFKYTATLFDKEKVFLSEQILKELCFECIKKNGEIKLNKYSDNNYIYQLCFESLNNSLKKEEINVLIKVKGSNFLKKRYQLLKFSSTEAKYTNNASPLSCGFYIDRPKSLRKEIEK